MHSARHSGAVVEARVSLSTSRVGLRRLLDTQVEDISVSASMHVQSRCMQTMEDVMGGYDHVVMVLSFYIKPIGASGTSAGSG